MYSPAQREGNSECKKIMAGFIISQCGFRGKQKIHKLLVKWTVTFLSKLL